MNVYRMIYTRLNPEDSPWGKRDFHTVCYSTEFIRDKDLYEFERRIYFDPSEGIAQKYVVFFLEVHAQTCCVMLDVRNLPEDRDNFGRAGLFLVQGFVFPPEIWQQVANPNAFIPFMQQHCFANRQELLASGAIDMKTGHIACVPLTLPASAHQLPPLRSAFEQELFQLMYWHAQAKAQPLLVEGKWQDVHDLLSRLVAYLPNALKRQIAWDPAFDGGAVAHSPIAIVGYQAAQPPAVNPIVIDLASHHIANRPTLPPPDAFLNWVLHCHEQITHKHQLEEMFALSEFLHARASRAPDMQACDACFVAVNTAFIESKYAKTVTTRFDAKLAAQIEPFLTPPVKLRLLMSDFPAHQIAEFAEQAILNRQLTRKDLPIPQELKAHGSPVLRAIFNIWDGHADLSEHLNPDEARKFLNYLVHSAWQTEKWVYELALRLNVSVHTLCSLHEQKHIITLLLKGGNDQELLAHWGFEKNVIEQSAYEIDESSLINKMKRLLKWS